MEAVIAHERAAAAQARSTRRKQRYAETLHQSARSLLGVLNDVLDFSRLDGGRLELDSTPFDLHDLVQGVGHAFAGARQREGPHQRRRYRRQLPALRRRRSPRGSARS